jgi:hypothetical protein
MVLCVRIICISVFAASTQNLQIQAQPSIVDLRQNDLVILCSITSPSQLDQVFIIQLMKNNSGTELQNVASVRAVNGQDTVLWQDSTLQGRATVTGSVRSPAAAQLRLTISQDSVKCPADFTGYKCTMSGLDNSLASSSQETNQIFVSYRGWWTFFNSIHLFLIME